MEPRLAKGEHALFGNLPEVTAAEFSKLNLNDYSWIHFEERPNSSNIFQMINQVRKWNEISNKKPITISVEIEKCREGSEAFLDKGDVVFISKDFAGFLGYDDMESAIHGLIARVQKRATLVCGWGDKGACGMTEGEGQSFRSPAFPPENLVNSLGAGDTFNASVIHALSNGKELKFALAFGCKLAGAKCGILKWDDIASIATTL